MSDPTLDTNPDEMPLVSHLIELRTRLMHIIGATLVAAWWQRILPRPLLRHSN